MKLSDPNRSTQSMQIDTRDLNDTKQKISYEKKTVQINLDSICTRLPAILKVCVHNCMKYRENSSKRRLYRCNCTFKYHTHNSVVVHALIVVLYDNQTVKQKLSSPAEFRIQVHR